MSAVTIVDSGANYASLGAALTRLGARYEISADVDTVRAAERIILPGVGHVSDTWSRLQKNGLTETLAEFARPLLGICVGMQVMFDYCEEGEMEGLGVFAGAVRRLPYSGGIRIPHCGWNQLDLHAPCALTARLDRQTPAYVYFVHSYAAPVNDATVASSDHGRPFSAVVASGNYYGVQFHPERSAQVGSCILSAFLDLDGGD